MRFKLFKGNNILAGYSDSIKDAQERCDQQKGWYYELPKDIIDQELSQHVVWLCVNKQLEPFKVTYTDVKKGGTHEYIEIPIVVTKKVLFIPYQVTEYKKVIWYQYYTIKTEEEFNTWKNFCIKTIIKYLKFSKKQAEKEFSSLNLAFGLKQKYLHERNINQLD